MKYPHLNTLYDKDTEIVFTDDIFLCAIPTFTPLKFKPTVLVEGEKIEKVNELLEFGKSKGINFSEDLVYKELLPTEELSLFIDNIVNILCKLPKDQAYDYVYNLKFKLLVFNFSKDLIEHIQQRPQLLESLGGITAILKDFQGGKHEALIELYQIEDFTFDKELGLVETYENIATVATLNIPHLITNYMELGNIYRSLRMLNKVGLQDTDFDVNIYIDENKPILLEIERFKI